MLLLSDFRGTFPKMERSRPGRNVHLGFVADTPYNLVVGPLIIRRQMINTFESLGCPSRAPAYESSPKMGISSILSLSAIRELLPISSTVDLDEV